MVVSMSVTESKTTSVCTVSLLGHQEVITNDPLSVLCLETSPQIGASGV